MTCSSEVRPALKPIKTVKWLLFSDCHIHKPRMCLFVLTFLDDEMGHLPRTEAMLCIFLQVIKSFHASYSVIKVDIYSSSLYISTSQRSYFSVLHSDKRICNAAQSLASLLQVQLFFQKKCMCKHMFLNFPHLTVLPTSALQGTAGFILNSEPMGGGGGNSARTSAHQL